MTRVRTKRRIAGLAAALALALPAVSLAEERTLTFVVENMTCALCPVTVRMAVMSLEGVREVQVDDATDLAVVTFDDDLVTADQIAAASRDAGYPARLVE